MSGLDKMKSRILEEAEQSAQEIIEKAEADAEAVVKAAVEEAHAEAAKLREKAEQSAADYAKRAASSADMRRKQANLAAKQDVISAVLGKAYDTVMELDADEYFGMLEKILEKHVLPEKGEICFSQRDLARMPEGFTGKIKTIAASKGGSLALSDEARRIDGGFLLIYGGIEENCTIKAVFDSKREELSDRVKRLLFG
ncbi:MAG TPA: V-type ATP synthase subunit E [Candidatus Mediterraneibacter intestinipullorum]|nr:V-type ATP synthase subunit E [Candidatus Mediterraneibacter intestinipullorum]